jgi:aspartate/methionine/tyrosine aminotransferase
MVAQGCAQSCVLMMLLTCMLCMLYPCAQVLCERGDKGVVLASMHSISKGFYGECGRRGGYVELVGWPADVAAEFYKLASINLCSNLNGQICMALVMNPPKARLPRICFAKDMKTPLH